MNTQHEKLKDIRVRKAIQRAIDVNSILDAAYRRNRARRRTASSPSGVNGNRTQSKYSYNPDEARALLKEAGVSDLSLEFKTLNESLSRDGGTDRAGQPCRCRHQGRHHSARFRPVLESRPRVEGRRMEDPATVVDALPHVARSVRRHPVVHQEPGRHLELGALVAIRSIEELWIKGFAETDTAKREEIYLRMQEIMEDTGAYVWITHDPLNYVHSEKIVPEFDTGGELLVERFKSA